MSKSIPINNLKISPEKRKAAEADIRNYLNKTWDELLLSLSDVEICMLKKQLDLIEAKIAIKH